MPLKHAGLIERAIEPQSLGFAAHWTWIWCVFWSSLFYSEGEAMLSDSFRMAGFAQIEPLWVVSLLSNVVCMAFPIGLLRGHKTLAETDALPWAAAGLTCLGTAMLGGSVLGLFRPVAGTLYVVGAVLTGLGSGAVVLLWGELLAADGSRRTISVFISALATASACYLIISLLPRATAQFLCALLPLASMGLYRVARRDDAPRLRQQQGRRPPRFVSHFPRRLVLIALFFGCSFGAMKGFMSPISERWTNVRDLLNIAGIVAGVVALYLSTNVLRLDFNHLTYQVALPLMAAGFLFLPFHEPASVIGTAVHQCGYQYFYIVLWSTWPIIAEEGDMPVGLPAAWSMLAIQFGQFVGSTVSAASMPLFSSDLSRAVLSSWAVFVILLVALFVFGDKTATTGWGYAKPGDEGREGVDPTAAAARLANQAGLSPREAEVFALLAHGRTRSYIGNELSIGEETVKSHVKGIYRKMGLHSQQDAIDLLDEECARQPSGPAD